MIIQHHHRQTLACQQEYQTSKACIAILAHNPWLALSQQQRGLSGTIMHARAEGRRWRAQGRGQRAEGACRGGTWRLKQRGEGRRRPVIHRVEGRGRRIICGRTAEVSTGGARPDWAGHDSIAVGVVRLGWPWQGVDRRRHKIG